MSHTPQELLAALLRVTEQSIVPLTSDQVSRGSKVFGAAILRKSDLGLVQAATNNERESPLLHGEINCIQLFFQQRATGAVSADIDPLPTTKDCIFFATHEPCSLCLSGITWAGFNSVYFLFSYEDSRDRFAIPYDIDILRSVFQVPSPTDTQESLDARPLYNRTNKFFTARSLSDLVNEIGDATVREHWQGEVARVRALYDRLSETYQQGKTGGAQTSSFFK